MIAGLPNIERNGMMDNTLTVSAMAIMTTKTSIHDALRFSAGVNMLQIFFRVSRIYLAVIEASGVVIDGVPAAVD
jgi:hypothetical protein